MTEKTCMNCEFRRGSFAFGSCLRAGTYPDLQRKFPNGACDRDYSGWKPRRPKLLRLWHWIRSWVVSA